MDTRGGGGGGTCLVGVVRLHHGPRREVTQRPLAIRQRLCQGRQDIGQQEVCKGDLPVGSDNPPERPGEEQPRVLQVASLPEHALLADGPVTDRDPWGEMHPPPFP